MNSKEVGLDEDLVTLIMIMRELLLKSDPPCIKFMDIRKRVQWHQQKLIKVLRRGIKLGLITRCEDGYDLAVPITKGIYENMKIMLTIVDSTDNHLIMRHRVYAAFRNVGPIDIERLLIRVYGDIYWNEPLRIRYQGTEVIKELSSEVCPNNMCNFIIELNRSLKPGELLKYDYEFCLYYYPPRDYFSIDLINSIKKLIIKIPRSYGNGMQIMLGNVEALGTGFVKAESNKDFHVVQGGTLLSPGMLKIQLIFSNGGNKNQQTTQY
jgi:hypothetical protein